MTALKARELGKPPGICNVCWSDQTHHPADDGRGVYHCHHNDALAMPKADYSGWIVETGIDRDEYIRRAEEAATTLELLTANAGKMN